MCSNADQPASSVKRNSQNALRTEQNTTLTLLRHVIGANCANENITSAKQQPNTARAAARRTRF